MPQDQLTTVQHCTKKNLPQQVARIFWNYTFYKKLHIFLFSYVVQNTDSLEKAVIYISLFQLIFFPDEVFSQLTAIHYSLVKCLCLSYIYYLLNVKC